MNKLAIVTGSHGQDGSYLCKLLLEKNYRVIAADRRSSRNTNWRHIELGIENELENVDFDLNDANSIYAIFKNYKKIKEFYNLAAQSHVSVSFTNPIFTTQIGTLGSISILEAIRHLDKDVKFYQASSSEMFGGSSKELLNEKSLFDAKSPYGASKVFAHEMTRNYRESYGLFACSGILFNHESPLRGEEFVTKKIVKSLVQIKFGKKEFLELGNIYSKRDWGFAGDYVQAMWLMLQQKTPDDYVISTGDAYSVKDFLYSVFNSANLDVNKYVEIDTTLFRPQEVPYLLGDSTKAKEKLGWTPRIKFDELAAMMYSYDIKRITELAFEKKGE